MAREIGRLKAVTVAKAKTPGLIADGGGLYLRIGPTGAKSWIFRYRRDGRLHDMGLGAAHTISLADAREKAHASRKLRLENIDPIEARQAGRVEAKLAAASAVTFRECAERYIEAHRAGWRNDRHADQWPSSLEAYAYPTLGDLPVQTIDVALVLKVLEPIWTARPETANRVRGRIESIIDWATARGYRRGENPARWRGHLENLLPRKSKLRTIQHHVALPYRDIASFLTELRQEKGIAVRALEFAILTAARAGEFAGARWDEINMAERIWIVPARRMKAGKEHRVPLSHSAMAIIEEMAAIPQGEYVFPGGKPNRAITTDAMRKLLRRMGFDNVTTVHGFRSTFRDWAAEQTNFPREVAEMALAHKIGDAVERAYRRGDLFQKRRQLAEAWARFCNAAPLAGEVVPIRAGATIE
jgi:integrase